MYTIICTWTNVLKFKFYRHYPDNNFKYKNRKQAEALYDTLFLIELFASFFYPNNRI